MYRMEDVAIGILQQRAARVLLKLRPKAVSFCSIVNLGRDIVNRIITFEKSLSKGIIVLFITKIY
jgi:hypothetical protein